MRIYRDAVLRNVYDVIVVGAGLGGMTAASLLAKRGISLLMIDQQNKPGGVLWSKGDSDKQIQGAIGREIQAILSSGITFKGGKQPGKIVEYNQLLEKYQAIYIANSGLTPTIDLNPAGLGNDWKNKLDLQTGQLMSQPKSFIGEEYSMNGVSVVQAVANGRKAAVSISEFLKAQPG